MFVCWHTLYTLIPPIAADCADRQDPVVACYPTLFTCAAMCKFTLLVHRIGSFLVVLLLRGHIPLVLALAGQQAMSTALEALWYLQTDCAHGLQGCVHITGGGFTENLPRVMPKGLACQVQTSSWEWPPLFQWLQQVGENNFHDDSADM